MPRQDERFMEAEVERVRKKLWAMYDEASREIYRKTVDFRRRHQALDRMYKQKVQAGEITEADYRAWKQGGQVFQSEDWKRRQRQIAEAMTRVDETAARMVRRSSQEVFGEAMNRESWRLENEGKGEFGLQYSDDHAIDRLIMEEPDLLPRPRVDKYQDYDWYNRQVSGFITQAIIQGEDVDGIIKRMCVRTAEKGLEDAARNARTAFTGAMNGGRVKAMVEAEKQGFEIMNCWVCSFMATSRDAHVKLNGQKVKPGEPLQSDLGPIRFPGDPEAAPGNVYNCHCVAVEESVKYPTEKAERYDPVTGQLRGEMTYEEWKAWKNSPEGKEAAARQQKHNEQNRGQWGGGLSASQKDRYIAEMEKRMKKRAENRKKGG